MIVKNEEQLIGNCLGSVVKVADEIIVVDTGSKDRTVEIAQGLGARIIHHSWDGNYGKARNVYVRAARGNWILVLDGDEAIACRDLAKINCLVRRRSLIGYCLAIRNYTDDHDLMWNWHANDRTYSEEEKLSGCPGWVKTRMGGSSAPRSLEQGASGIVWAATLTNGIPNGGFFRDALRAGQTHRIGF